MPGQEERRRFISEHDGEIRPLLDKTDTEKLNNLAAQSPENLEDLLEQYESKLFFLEKSSNQYNEDAERVLLTANDPGAYNVIRLLIPALEKDPRCKGISFLGSGVGGQTFTTEFGKQFTQVRDKKPILEDILKFSEDHPVDIVITSVSSGNGPESIALFGGKSNLEAQKIFFISEAWGSLGSQYYENPNIPNMDKVDGIFCPDEIAKKILEHSLTGVPHESIIPIGTPVLDTLKVENSAEFTKQAREKFGIDEDTLSVSYGGGISFESHEVYGADKRVDERTFEETLDALIDLAKSAPDKKFAFLVRPHPRDPNKDELFSIIKSRSVPNNLKVVSATKEEATIQEVRYASDVVTSIGSTENFFAPNLGRTVIFLGYTHEPGLGGAVLDRVYGKELMQVIKDSDPKMNVAKNPQEMAAVVAKSSRAPEDISQLPIAKGGNTTEKMLNKIFEETK